MSTQHPAKLRVAVVGAGYVASHHLAALKRLDFVELVGICDSNVAAAESKLSVSGERPPAAVDARGSAASSLAPTWPALSCVNTIISPDQRRLSHRGRARRMPPRPFVCRLG